MFEVIHNPYVELTSIFHKSFHQCSKSSPCNFVVKDTTTNKYETHNNESDITQDRRKLIIWKRKSILNFHTINFWINSYESIV